MNERQKPPYSDRDHNDTNLPPDPGDIVDDAGREEPARPLPHDNEIGRPPPGP
jgi:hypothetical protein